MSDSFDEVQVPETSSPTVPNVVSSSPLKVPEKSTAASSTLQNKFSFKPHFAKNGTKSVSTSVSQLKSSSSMDSTDYDKKLQTLCNEYSDFSRTLIQAVFKSNSFDMDMARGRLNRLTSQKDTWSHSASSSPLNPLTSPSKSNNNGAGSSTQRFVSLRSNNGPASSSTKITLNKPKSSIFDRYSNVIQSKRATDMPFTQFIPSVPTSSGIVTSKNKRRKLVRGDHVKEAKNPTELDNAKNKLLKLKAQKLMDKEESGSETENESNDEAVSDDDEGGDYEDNTGGVVDLDDQILEFLNTANVLDIADLADTSFDKAQVIVSKRPFTSLVLFNDMDFLTEDEVNKKNELENTPSPSPGVTTSGRGRRRGTPRNQRKDGEKFLEKISEAIKGYNAIESLLKKCSSYGDLITNQISKWGVSIKENDGGNTNDDKDDEGLHLMTVDDDEDNSNAIVDGFDETDVNETPEPTAIKDEGIDKMDKSIKTENATGDTVREEKMKEDEKANEKLLDDEEEEDIEEDHDDEEEDEEYMDDEEMVEELDDDDDDEEEEFVQRKSRYTKQGRTQRKDLIKFFRGKPRLLSKELQLKDYQQTGINWLNLLYHNNLSCILADDMGLGKTCQVISFLAYLKQINEPGPHLIVVPSSTLENWLREFKKFCPVLKIEPYYGSQNERAELREMLENAEGQYDVIVTTYNLAAGNKYDVSFLRHRQFNVIVYDEGHMLKNSMSERFTKLMKIQGNFRLLLTGTPLQNNLRELMSLLEFIMPSLFISKKDSLATIFKQKARTTDDNKGHNPLLVQNAIERAKTMMNPFILRRKKDQVLKHLPAKHSKIVSCEMNSIQREIYNKEIQNVMELRRERKENNNDSDDGKSETKRKAKKKNKADGNTSKNLIMTLRKASIHPLLFRHIYDDKLIDKMSRAILREPAYAVDGNKQYIMEDMSVMTDFELHKLCESFPKTLGKFKLQGDEWMRSGKVDKLQGILHDVVHVKREKILIFSLFTQVLDILEMVLTTLNYKFLRLDGSTQVNERQGLIDKFYEDDTIPVFILSTKAGGFGINLVCANHVVIFDQSFNPHDDRQAADRSHRVGQTKEVTISTLITGDSIEEKIHQLAKNKLALDTSVSEDDKRAQDAMETRVSAILEDIIVQEEEQQAARPPEDA